MLVVRYVIKSKVQVNTDNPKIAYRMINCLEVLKVDLITFARVMMEIENMMIVHHFEVLRKTF